MNGSSGTVASGLVEPVQLRLAGATDSVWSGCACVGQGLPELSGIGDQLIANERLLTIQCGVGQFNFRPGKVLHIERAGAFPWFWRGLMIEHRMPGYPLRIGFLPGTSSTRQVLEQLVRLGYWVI